MPATRIPLLEGVKGAFAFSADRAKIVTESLPGGGSITRIPGKLSLCDAVNGNNRRYPRPVWEKNLKSGSPLQESIKRNAAFGLLEHPSDGVVSLLSPISHIVSKAILCENGEVTGEIVVLGTAEGQKLTALIEGGYDPLVSSRGFGSLTTGTDGVDVVQEDFICEGWDVVIKPSFEVAQLTPNRGPSPALESQTKSAYDQWFEATQRTPSRAPSPALESAPAAPVLTASTSPISPSPVAVLKESVSPQAPAASPAKPALIMTINEIKQRMAALRGQDPSKLTPSRFAESLTESQALHTEVAKFVAEDATRSYEGSKLHKQLEEHEARMEAAQKAPTAAAHKLQENLNKVLKVTNVVVERGLQMRKQLGEALKKDASNTRLVEELTKNGTDWKNLADKRKARLEHTEKKYVTACEMVDSLVKRYNEDVTLLGGRVLQLEFKESAHTPDVARQIKEASKPKQIMAIRERLEKGAKPASGAAKTASGAAKPVQEVKTATSATAPVQESKKAPISVTQPVQPSLRNLSESVSMARRLSAAQVK